MGSIIYKTLFKVQILHEYYLTNSDETTVFDNLNNKDTFLMENFSRNLPSVSEDLIYEVPLLMRDLFSNFHLRLVPDYSGFSIVTEVREEILADGTTTYKPIVPIPATVNLIVQLSLKNNLLATVTNKRIFKNIPSVYYFTNEDIPSVKTFPVLSASVPAFDSSYRYEQGELYTNSSGRLCLFYINGSDKDFLPVTGEGYVNASDEILVPLQFTYLFTATNNVTKAHFKLNDHTGKTVRSYTFVSSSPIKKQLINFRYNQNPTITNPPDDPIASLPLSVVSEETVYRLSVTINDSATTVQKLVFFDGGDVLTGCWGIVNIKPQVSNPDYNLYDGEGLIRYRKQIDGTVISAPVFEMRVKSRSAFWRYINDRNAVLKADSGSPFLQRDGSKNLASKLPRNASALPRMYTIKDSTGKIIEEEFLPNPRVGDGIIIEGQKLYTDIIVPQSSLFPVDTS